MREQAAQNKKAWEYRAYEFWQSEASPAEKAAEIRTDPLARLHLHRDDFRDCGGKKIANVCGSNGRKAVPLALLGADVTVFDISEENRRYALELAECAGVSIGFELGDFVRVDDRFRDTFDIVYAEGGVLHYFCELDDFMAALYRIAMPGGRLLLNDFHPFRKANHPASDPGYSPLQTEGDYFDARVHQGNVAYKRFFAAEEQGNFPDCSLRFYTLSEIVNGVLGAGFRLLELREHPDWTNPKLPGQFTICAEK